MASERDPAAAPAGAPAAATPPPAAATPPPALATPPPQPGGRRGRWLGPAGRARWPAWAYAGLVALYLVPFWAAPIVPTTDGGSHVYNAWLLGQLAGPSPAPLLRQHYEINPQPVPNYLTHVVLLALMDLGLGGPTAEKALLSGYVLLLAGGLWYLAGATGRGRAWVALLGLPFVWNTMLQFGFYNFCVSIGFFLLTLGLWWRHRERPGLGFAILLNVLLVLCYFGHIVSAVLAFGGIGVLWLASWRRERWRDHLVHLEILAPAAALPFWFMVLRHSPPGYASQVSWQEQWAELAHLRPLWSFAWEEGLTGTILARVFAGWVAFTLVRRGIAWRRRAGAGEGSSAAGVGGDGGGAGGGSEAGGAGSEAGDIGNDAGDAVSKAGGGRRRWPWWREEDGFLALALLLAALYFASPEGAAGGSLLKARLLLYPFLVLLPWLSAELGRRGRAAAVLALAALAVRPVTFAVPCYRTAGREVAEFVRGLDAVPPGSVVVPLIFDRNTGCLRTGAVNHATGYAAQAKGLVDWDNYEATTDYFPVRFRPWVMDSGGNLSIETDPWRVKVRQLQWRADYIYCWRMPPESQTAGRLARRCTLVAAGKDWRLYSTDVPAGSEAEP